MAVGLSKNHTRSRGKFSESEGFILKYHSQLDLLVVYCCGVGCSGGVTLCGGCACNSLNTIHPEPEGLHIEDSKHYNLIPSEPSKYREGSVK